MGTAHRWEGLLPCQESHGLGDDKTEERSHDRDFGSCNKNSLGGLKGGPHSVADTLQMLSPTKMDLKHRMPPRYIGGKYSAKDMSKPETQGERTGHLYKPPEEAQRSNSCITEFESW